MRAGSLASGAFWAVALGSAACDVVSKWWAYHSLVVGQPWPREAFPRFRLAFNSNLNAGLTIPGGGYFVYCAIGIALMVGLLIAVANTPTSERIQAICFAITFGGGASNVIERVIRGNVTDFIDFGYGSFNVADIAIASGAILYLIYRTREDARLKALKREAGAPPGIGPV